MIEGAIYRELYRDEDLDVQDGGITPLCEHCRKAREAAGRGAYEYWGGVAGYDIGTVTCVDCGQYIMTDMPTGVDRLVNLRNDVDHCGIQPWEISGKLVKLGFLLMRILSYDPSNGRFLLEGNNGKIYNYSAYQGLEFSHVRGE